MRGIARTLRPRPRQEWSGECKLGGHHTGLVAVAEDTPKHGLGAPDAGLSATEALDRRRLHAPRQAFSLRHPSWPGTIRGAMPSAHRVEPTTDGMDSAAVSDYSHIEPLRLPVPPSRGGHDRGDLLRPAFTGLGVTAATRRGATWGFRGTCPFRRRARRRPPGRRRQGPCLRPRG